MKTELKLVCEERDGYWYVLNPEEVVETVKGIFQPVLDAAEEFGIG